MDLSYTSQNSSASFNAGGGGGVTSIGGGLGGGVTMLEKPSFFISDGNISAPGFDSNPSTPLQIDFLMAYTDNNPTFSEAC